MKSVLRSSLLLFAATPMYLLLERKNDKLKVVFYTRLSHCDWLPLYLVFYLFSCYTYFMNAILETKETTRDIGIDWECPICSRLRDLKTGALPYNAKALAAMEESRAKIRGEIPAKMHKPEELEKVWKEMLED